MRYQSYFNTAVKIIHAYRGDIPLQHFLKKYFAEHKKHGSKDRKIIAHICYCFYRLGKSFAHLPVEEKLKISIFLCNERSDEWSFLYNEDWLNNWSNSLQARIEFVQQQFSFFSMPDVFPFNDVSETLEKEQFIQSFFTQPDVFIRIRPNKQDIVLHKLSEQNIQYHQPYKNCIALPASAKIDAVINIDNEAVVQDYSSQRVQEFLTAINSQNRHQLRVWDCCAASGGKSILVYDVLQNIQLTVSDVRSSIIQNLKQRFAKAGITNYTGFVADITKSFQQTNLYDIIICDAPCTGSGTWSRTPEQVYFFRAEKIVYYNALQKQIASAAIKSLKSESYFLYITCSVFAAENEDVVEFIKKQFHLELIKMELLKGYNNKADTIFAALFKRN